MKTLQKPEVMMGHVRDCLSHFAKTVRPFTGTEEATKRKKPMADFCQVHTATITKWINDDEVLPTGETLIRLMFFLELLGYRVIELEIMPALFRNFAELIGYGVLNAQQASELLEFSMRSGSWEIYRLLLKEGNDTSDRRKELMLHILRERKAELEEHKKQAEETYYLGFATGLPQEPPVLAVVRPHEQYDQIGVGSPNVSAAIHIMAGLLNLLDGSHHELSNGSLSALTHEEVQVVLRLSGRLNDVSAKLIGQAQRKEG